MASLNTQIFRKIQSAAAGTDNRHGRRQEAWRLTRLRRGDDRHRAELDAWAAAGGYLHGPPPEMHGDFDGGIIIVATADGDRVTFSFSPEPEPDLNASGFEPVFEDVADDDQAWRVVAGLSSGPPPRRADTDLIFPTLAPPRRGAFVVCGDRGGGIMTPLLAAASLYFSLGWQRLIPIPYGRKGPVLDGWQHLVLTEADLPHYFGRAGNIGVMPVGGLVDIDLDADEAVTLGDIYLPPTQAVFGRRSKPRAHRLFAAPGSRYQGFADPLAGKDEKATLLELRAGKGLQTVFPPSVADGEARCWEGPPAAATIAAQMLRQACAWLAVGCLVARYVSEGTAREPTSDLPNLLMKTDERLGRAAYRWLGWPLASKASDADRATHKPYREADGRRRREPDLFDLAERIANVGYDWWDWNAIGMAFYATDPGPRGLEAFDHFSRKHPRYDRAQVLERWSNYGKYPPTRSSVGRLIYLANGGVLS